MILELCVIIAYGVLAYVPVYMVVYEGWPTKALAGLYAYFLFGEGESPSGISSRNSSRGPLPAKGPKKDTSVDWDEDASKVVRFQIPEAEIVRRPFFAEYNHCAMFFLVTVLVIVGRLIVEPLPIGDAARAALARTDFVLMVLGFLGVSKFIQSLSHAEYDKATTHQVDFVGGVSAGAVTAALMAAILFSPASSALDFRIEEAAIAFVKSAPHAAQNGSVFQPAAGAGSQAAHSDEKPRDKMSSEGEDASAGISSEPQDVSEFSTLTVSGVVAGVKIFMCAFAGAMGFIFLPATVRVARCYTIVSTPFPWSGGILKYSKTHHGLCSLAFALPPIATMCWLTPMVDVFITQTESASSERVCSSLPGTAECPLNRELFFSQEVVEIARQLVLFLSNIAPLFLVRTILQAHLDSAYIHWYQTIHGPVGGSNVTRLTQNMQIAFHFFCKVALQCSVPQFLGLSFQLLSWACSLTNLARFPFLHLSSHLFTVILIMCSWCSTTVWSAQILLFMLMYRLGQVR